jgi:acetyl esterase
MTFDLHPEVKPLIEARAALPAGKNLEEDRANWSAYARANNVSPPANINVKDSVVAGRDGVSIPIRIYSPSSSGPKAAIAYFHGGGFVKGDCDTSDTTGWGLASETGAVVVSVDYRLAPENKFPAALHDCVDVLLHMQNHPSVYGIDASRLAVAGDSAGGNLAAATALWARENGGPRLKAQGLIYPCLTDRLEFDSYKRNASAPGLTTQSMQGYWIAYLGDIAGKSVDPMATPLIAKDLSNLPPTFILVAEHDPLIDDGVEYAAKLMRAGVETSFFRAERMIHGFIRARVTGPDAAAAFARLSRFLCEKLA